jgi:hypothetical protein
VASLIVWRSASSSAGLEQQGVVVVPRRSGQGRGAPDDLVVGEADLATDPGVLAPLVLALASSTPCAG